MKQIVVSTLLTFAKHRRWLHGDNDEITRLSKVRVEREDIRIFTAEDDFRPSLGIAAFAGYEAWRSSGWTGGP